jgi:hypothetical protein
MLTSPRQSRGAPVIPVWRRRRLAVFLLCVVLDVVALRPFLAKTHLARGQLQRGYFEAVGSQIGLALDDDLADRFIFPGLSRDQAGDLSIPPGTTAVLSLQAGTTYQVSADGGGLPANLVVGVELHPPPGSIAADPTRPEPPTAWFGQPRELDVAGGERVQLRPWDAARSWRDESARLAGLARDCVGAAPSPPVTVSVDGEQLTVRLGRCTLSVPLAEIHGGAGRPLLAVVAGPSWDLVRRNDGAWETETSVVWRLAWAVPLVAAAQVGLFWIGFNVVAAVATSVALALVSVAAAAPAAVCVLLALAVGLGRVAWLGVARLWAATDWKLRLTVLGALVAAVAVWVLLPPRTERGSVAQNPSGFACVLTGYSTADDSALRPGTRGTGTWLATACAPCAGAAATRARAGVAFQFVDDVACAQPPLVRPEGTLVFLGGTNDDLLTWFDARSQVVQMILQLRGFASATYQRKPGLDNLTRLETETARASLRVVDHQEQLLHETFACARAAGFRLLFAQDFLLSDLVGGRPEERRAMVARRRELAEADGTRFFDLLEEFGDQAGVAWFNDFMHLSMVGHRRVAELVCRSIADQPG